MERARRKKELALLQKMQSEKDAEVKQTAQQEPEKKEPEPPKDTAPAEMKKPQMAKKEPAQLPVSRPKIEEKPALAAAPEKKVKSSRPRRPRPRQIVKTTSMPKPKAGDMRKKRLPAKSRIARAPKRSAKAPPGSYFSIQVATCRTDKCVKSFVRNLRAKGFKPFVGGGGRGSALAQTEVLLGDFANKSAAEALASKAKGKKFRTTVYKSGSKWLVSARKFTDLEEAAQRLDQVEDSGFVGRLSASKAVSKKIALRTVRIGKMTSRQDAVAMLARINRSGFSGSYVVRRK